MPSDAIVFYSVFSIDNDADCQDLGVLTKIRTEFFTSGKKQKGNVVKKVNDKIYNYFYSIEKDKPANWKKSSNGKVYEKSRVNSDNTYSILYQNENKKLLKIATFDCSHNWVKTEYFTAEKKFVFEKLKNGLEILVSIYEKGNKFYESYTLYGLNFSAINNNFTADSQVLPKMFCITNLGKIGYFDERQIEKLKNLEIEKEAAEPEQLSLYDSCDDCNKNAVSICEKSINNNAQKLNEECASKNFFTETSNIPQDITTAAATSSCNEENLAIVSQHQQKNNFNLDETYSIRDECETALNKELEKSNNFCEKSLVKTPKVESKPSNFAENTKEPVTDNYFYFGETNQNMRHGLGRTTNMTGKTMYEGHYKDDMRDGFGVLYDNFSDFCYVGSFCENKKEGLGVTFNKTKNLAQISVWNDGELGKFLVICDKKGSVAILDKSDNIILKFDVNCEQIKINNSKIGQVAFVNKDEVELSK